MSFHSISKVNQEESKRFLVVICYPPDNQVAFEYARELLKGTLIIYICDEEYELAAFRRLSDAITWLVESKASNELGVEGTPCGMPKYRIFFPFTKKRRGEKHKEARRHYQQAYIEYMNERNLHYIELE